MTEKITTWDGRGSAREVADADHVHSPEGACLKRRSGERCPDTSAPLSAEQVLAQHQRCSNGMTYRSPDTCACGAEVMPDASGDDPRARRDRAFAAHQVAMLQAVRDV